ncbi:hypothetical protein HMPREF9140_00641 [Prevotella micans F0438]|jgi:hypothetical protein|uniref:Secretion system C-terminal sorting domain-containing protein n=1 Tax=Prevotella micans F0438 TaxID=883158 RepID=H1Q153_9BACT|nr:T9SS type A sorting domain-containing protein [Prevotella micans]EHO72881.1 hypothetical protein HMPREF9140_00641 [Prevotella micans F0438]
MKKRKLFIAIGLLIGTGCFAQSASEITIKSNSGNKTYKVSELKNIAIENGGLKVNRIGKAAESFSFDDIKDISFNVVSGIEETPLPASNLSIYSPANSNVIYVKGYEAGKRYEVAVFSTSGETVLRNSNWKGEPVNIGSLAKGVYVFKINNTTFKFRK